MTNNAHAAGAIEAIASALAGRYRIQRELGAGGMATVWLAEDVKHRRKVAVKVLHPELSAVLGGERFLKEIELTASLQHPHILPLFDSGEAGGQLFYVMPFVEGETLRTRLEREKQLPIGDALLIAREVADALQYAHDRGVVHRDIKPENILLHGGPGNQHALVADFGIALAVQQAGGTRMTQTGLSLGTPQYMAPEQAMGEKTVDARADVYALGAVTYEMLCGDPPFTGSTAQAIVARMMTDRPASIRTLRETVPAGVEAAVITALAKLPADRFASARELRMALEEGRHAPPGGGAAAQASVAPSRSSSLPIAAAALVAVTSLGVAAWALQRGDAAPSAPVVQLVLETPNANPDLARFAVSPDGARFAFGTDEGIALRDAGQREYRVLGGTEVGEAPAFTADGEWIVYQTQGHLRKVPVAGGTPLPLIANDSVLGGRVATGSNGTIAFETGGRIAVIEPDGVLRILTKTVAALSPRIDPDGKGFFYVREQQGSHLTYYDLARDTVVEVLSDASEGQLLPSGDLLYCSTLGGLYVVGFDRGTYRTSGTPVPVALDVEPNGAVAPFQVTRNGTLVYRAGRDPEMQIVLREPSGALDTLPLAPKALSYLRFSPDAKTLALTVGTARGTNRHTALYDLERGTLTRFTTEGGGHAPIWSPDGKQLAYTIDGTKTDAEDIAIRPIDGSAPPRMLPRLPNDQHSVAWPDDTTLVFSSNAAPRTLGGRPGGGSTQVLDPVTGTGVRDYLNAAWGEWEASVSPDGRWIAYTSRETGREEIQVRRFTRPQPTGKWKVSASGGQRARWSPDGRTLYFVNGSNTAVQAVSVNAAGEDFTVGPARTVLTLKEVGGAWDVDRVTGRIAVSEPVVSAGVRLVVQQGWLADFQRARRAAAAK